MYVTGKLVTVPAANTIAHLYPAGFALIVTAYMRRVRTERMPDVRREPGRVL
jgi:hypothetical protein